LLPGRRGFRRFAVAAGQGGGQPQPPAGPQDRNPTARGIISLGRPGFVIAGGGGAMNGPDPARPAGVGLGRPGRVGGIFHFPDARRRQVAFRHASEAAVEPAVPFGRHAAGIVGAVVDHPAALAALEGVALGIGLLGAVVLVALGIVAHEFAIARAVEQGAEGGAVPPGEDLAENAHEALFQLQPAADGPFAPSA
jgi:hypothetical protein